MTLERLKPYIQGAILLGGVGLGILCGRACVSVPPPAVVVPSDTVVVEETVPVFKEPEVVEKVHIKTKPVAITTEGKAFVEAVRNMPADDAGINYDESVRFRVTFDGEKVFTQDGATVRYGWRGTGNCEVMADGTEWITLGSSPIDLIGSHAVGLPPIATPKASEPRNRFTMGAGYGNGGWVALVGVSRSLAWKHKITKAVMPEEIGVVGLMHASHDVDVIATGSWRF